MACSEELLAQKGKLQQEILALESSLGNGRDIADLLSSDTDSTEDSEDSGHEGEGGAHKNLEAERQQIQREIEELERTLGADAALIDALTDSEHGSLMDSNGEDSDEDLELPQDLETCLQMNLVYQEVLKEKLADLERLLKENRDQRKDLEEQLSGPSSTSAGMPHHRLFLGNFMKPYFKDKLTALGPPANEETKERLANGTKPCDERKIRRWEPWQKTLLIKSVATDTMKRMLQPKLSKMEYITTKMSKAKDAEKQEIQNQITLLEQEITEIRSLREDQLYGACHDYHDWDKIANTDFECFRQPDDLMRFWQNYLHPSINKSTWSQEEITKLADVAEQHTNCHWERIAESLETNRTAFMCFQTYQRYISKRFRKREWNNEEDQLLRELVDKMRIGNFIPYTQISYFMEGRDNSQLIYRWTCVLDPSLKKGPWTKEEDELLLKAVKKYGCKEWWKIKLEVPGRTDNACRDRYLDCLRTDVKRGAWSDDEVELLKKLVVKYGVGKWSKIAAEIPNRVDSQCLNKWKWMQKVARKGVKRGRGRSVKREPEMKRRLMRQKNGQKVKTGSDSSGDEEEIITYMDSDCEQPVENVCPVTDCKPEYVQPDMKKWIPSRRNKLAHSSVKTNTTLVRLPTEAEESGTDCVLNTVLDKLGNPVKTYVGMEPPALQNPNLTNEHTMIMVSENDVKCLLICIRNQVIKARSSKIQTRLASCKNQNVTKNDQKEEKSKTESGKRRRKAVAITQNSFDLMVAITPWVGNVIMHLPFSRTRPCEVDIVQKRAAVVPLPKSTMFLLFLQALKVDADGCKKVIASRKGKVSSMPGFGSVPSSDIAERLLNKKHSSPLQFGILYPHLLPQSDKIAIPPLPKQQRKTKQASKKAIKSASQKEMQLSSQKPVMSASQKPVMSASQKPVMSASQIFPQTITHDPSKLPQPVFHSVVTVESERVTEPASCPATPMSTADPPAETVAEVRASKRKPKPTMKAQVLKDNRKNKISKKQATKKQQNGGDTQTVAVLAQTTAWILTPAGLVPVTEIQIQSPGIPANQKPAKPNNVQMIFQQPIIVNQSSCAAPNDPRPPDLPGNDIKSLPAGSNHGQNHTPSHVLDNNKVFSLPSSSNSTSVISAPVKNVLQVLPDTNVPSCNSESVTQEPPTKGNQNKTPISAMSSLVPSSSTPVGTSLKIAPTCSSDATNNVSRDLSVFAVTSTPSKSPVHLLNHFAPGNIPGPQSQTLPHIVPQVLFQQPIIVNQNGSLALIDTAGPCIPNNPLTITALAKATNVIKSPQTSSTNGAAECLDFCLNPVSVQSSVLNKASLSNPQSSFVNSPVRVSVGTLLTDPPISPRTTSCQIGPQIMMQQMAPEGKRQTVLTTSNSRPQQVTFDPSLMFFEQPAQVKNWLNGNGGITLPGLKENMPYLPPFVSSINTLSTLLKGRDSLLNSAVQLLPEEHKETSEEEAKITAVRKMVSERFKNNRAYMLLKARFLSCFTLPALLATINPVTESVDDLAKEDNKDKGKAGQFGEVNQLESLESLFNIKESELTEPVSWE